MLEIGSKNKLFNLAEAQELWPLVRKITEKHQQELEPIQRRLNLMLANDPRRKAVEAEYSDVVAAWRTKLEQLGVDVAGLWSVGFNVGEGFLSWKYPELTLAFFISHDAPQERLKLSDYIDEYDPDWAC